MSELDLLNIQKKFSQLTNIIFDEDEIPIWVMEHVNQLCNEIRLLRFELECHESTERKAIQETLDRVKQGFRTSP